MGHFSSKQFFLLLFSKETYQNGHHNILLYEYIANSIPALLMLYSEIYLIIEVYCKLQCFEEEVENDTTKITALKTGLSSTVTIRLHGL